MGSKKRRSDPASSEEDDLRTVPDRRAGRDATGKWQRGVSGNPATQFPKGVSGNPGGRVRLSEVEEAILQEYGPKYRNVIQRLYLGALRGNVAAAKEFGNRVVGMAKQRIEASGPGGQPLMDPGAELRAFLAKMAGDIPDKPDAEPPADPEQEPDKE